MEILIAIGPYLLPIIGSILALLAVAGVKKLLDKWGIDRSEKIDMMIDRYVTVGVNFAEVSARKYLEMNGSKMSVMSGMTKKTKAIKVVMDELKQSGVTAVAEELISARIESWLDFSGHKPGTPSDPNSGEDA